jgi:hypothetical protein
MTTTARCPFVTDQSSQRPTAPAPEVQSSHASKRGRPASSSPGASALHPVGRTFSRRLEVWGMASRPDEVLVDIRCSRPCGDHEVRTIDEGNDRFIVSDPPQGEPPI